MTKQLVACDLEQFSKLEYHFGLISDPLIINGLRQRGLFL